MKLVATIERKTTFGSKSITFTFPVGARPYTLERIVERNIGPRPWSEVSFWKNGQAIRIFVK